VASRRDTPNFNLDLCSYDLDVATDYAANLRLDLRAAGRENSLPFIVCVPTYNANESLRGLIL